MPPTQFCIPEKYQYLDGFGHYHQSEAIESANPIGANNPQKPRYGLSTERISGTSFTAQRSENLQTFLYRVTPSHFHGRYETFHSERLEPFNGDCDNITPNSYRWKSFPINPDGDWITGQRVIAQAGNPATKSGLSYSMHAVLKDMDPQTVFYSADGDYLIIPQAGALDIETELGNLLVRQNEIAVIPRGIRYKVSIPHGPARGYICELFHGHYKLPELGPIGSCCLANARDFQVPTARFDGVIEDEIASCKSDGKWRIVAKMNNRHFVCQQESTPFDIAAWHGSYYPYKYDLGRFAVLGSLLFDHPDPSLFTVLTAPSHREIGSSVVDFAVIPPRWQVMEDTYWAPYYYRNTMSEFSGSIIHSQDPDFPLSKGPEFKPYVAVLNNAMTTHGMDKSTHEAVINQDTSPKKTGSEGFSIFLLESELMLNPTSWGMHALDSS